jgi:hypothetical protein
MVDLSRPGRLKALAWDREGVNSWALKLGCATGGSKNGLITWYNYGKNHSIITINVVVFTYTWLFFSI